MGIFSKIFGKKKQEKETVTEDILRKVYRESISLVRKEISKYADVKKFGHINTDLSLEDFMEEEYMSIYLLDAWDITKRPRDENEYDSKVNPLFNKVNKICEDLNAIIEKNPTFKQFKFDTDGDWDSISIDIRRR